MRIASKLPIGKNWVSERNIPGFLVGSSEAASSPHLLWGLCFFPEPGLWKTVASALGGQRLAKRGRVAPGGTRAPKVILLLGAHGWVEHVDNGIR